MFYDELREAVSYFKKEPEGVNAMCEIMREFERKSKNEGRREGRAEGRAQERQKAKKCTEAIMRNLREEGMSYERIARITNQSLSKVKTFFKTQQIA